MPNVFYLNPHNNICGGNKIVFEHCNYFAKVHQKCFVVCDDIVPEWMSVNAFFVDRATALKLIRPEDIVVFHWDYDADYVLACSAKRKFYLIQHFVHKNTGLFRMPFEFLSVSSYIQEHTKQTYGVDSKLILNAIDHVVFYPRSIPREPYRIFAIDLGGWKGVQDVKKAERSVKQRLPQVKFVYKKGLTPDEMAMEYSRSSVFVSASWYEGFGLPPLEAMACGCAVVCTDSKGVNDFAIDNQTCLKVPPHSPHHLAKKICEVLINDEKRMILCKNGLEMAKQFTWDSSMEQLAKIYGLSSFIEDENLFRYCQDIKGIVYGRPSCHAYGDPVCEKINFWGCLERIKGGRRLLHFLKKFGISNKVRLGVFDYQKVQFIPSLSCGGVEINKNGQKCLFIPWNIGKPVRL